MTNYSRKKTAYFHLPGMYEFYELYRIFLPLFYEHREYFYEWCEIGSLYGSPADCIWGGGRIESGECDTKEVLAMLKEYGISGRLTFSNSLLREEHLSDRKCNKVCALFENGGTKKTCETTHNDGMTQTGDSAQNGVIIHSDLLLEYLKSTYPGLYFVSSTTKVNTTFGGLLEELKRDDFTYVVPDFRLNKDWENLSNLPDNLKDKVEFLCNECCYFGCTERKACYENVSRKNLGEICEDHHCRAPHSQFGYRFSEAMNNPGFIGVEDILNRYLPMGFSNYKIEGRGLGSAVVLEFLLYYMTRPQYRLKVREEIYLDSMLDLF